MSKRVDNITFTGVKRWLRVLPAKRVANKFDLHLSTVLNIRGSKNFSEYQEMVKAEHPPIKYSLAEDVFYMHRKFYDQKDGKYMPPRNAQVAMLELKRVKV